MEQQSVSEYCPRCQVVQPTFQFLEDGVPRRRCQTCGFPVEAALAEEAQSLAQSSAQEIKILCVDDDPLILQMLADILRFHGFTVETAPDGEAGLEAAGRLQPNLILLDVMMPGIDGFEVCRLLKADPAMKPVPVIFLTAMNDPALNAKAFEAGAVLAMQKTADTKAVIRTIEAALALSDRPAPAAEPAKSPTRGREAEGDLSVPMQLARATFWTEDDATFEGSVFLHLTAEAHDGPETVLDRLNMPDRFLVLSVADDSPVVLLNKGQIIRVDVPCKAAPPEVLASTANVEHVRLRLINGEQLDGTVCVEGPEGQHRLSSLLNAQSAFLPLQGSARLHLLQKRFISRIVPRESKTNLD
jgi:DNA-binding response OmpR family regulator